MVLTEFHVNQVSNFHLPDFKFSFIAYFIVCKCYIRDRNILKSHDNEIYVKRICVSKWISVNQGGFFQSFVKAKINLFDNIQNCFLTYSSKLKFLTKRLNLKSLWCLLDSAKMESQQKNVIKSYIVVIETLE